MTTKKAESKLTKVLAEFGLDLPGIRFLLRNSLYLDETVQVQEVDLTPQIFDPDVAGAGEPRRRCLSSRSIDLGGRAVTDASGKLTWKLSDFVCESDSQTYSEPASFVATPLSADSVSLTALVQSIGSDLVVEVFSWDASGAAAPRVGFFWRCWVAASPIVD